MTDFEELIAQLPRWLVGQRWFGAKGRAVQSVTPAAQTPLRADREPLLDLLVLRVGFDTGPDHLYQLLLGRRRDVRSDLEHSVIGQVAGALAYDAVWDPDATTWLLDAIREGRHVDAVRFVPEPGAEIAPSGPGRVLPAEQSNTSVTYGEVSILKLFRKIAYGVNPDLELHRALRSVGSAHVAQLQGAVEGVLDGRPVTYAILQDFAPNSADGWSMALTSLRDLLAEGDLRADEVGGDFAAESHRLGKTVAAVHRELALALGTSERDPRELAASWHARLDVATTEVPALAAHAPAIRASYDAVAELDSTILAQRVHGDLHLGQTLRTPYGWLLIDFEGEPAAPLAERVRPDSALRDVAGMLRSFEYAALHSLLQWDPRALDPGAPDTPQLWHAREWAGRNRSAFCDGYAAEAGTDPREQVTVLRAYELDKAVYEAMYERHSRPGWAGIPLASISRLVADAAQDV